MFLKTNPVYDFEYTQIKVRMLSLLAMLGFPTYYYIWQYLLPQQYENLTLRIVGTIFGIICFTTSFSKDETKQKHFKLLYFFLFTYSLPFFFTYLFLQNNANGAWLGSLICAILYLALIMNLSNFIIMTASGAGIAIIYFLLSSNTEIDIVNLLESIPVIIFAILGGLVMKFSEHWAITSNRKKSIALAGSLAHELRTPMLGLKMEIDNFIHLREEPEEDPSSTLNEDNYVETSQRLQRHIAKSSLIIDSLLQNVKEEKINTSAFVSYSLGMIIQDAIAHFPLTEKEKKLIHTDTKNDFHFWGDDLLMSHVIMNLLKNALRAVSIADRGTITISLNPADKKSDRNNYNTFIIRDTGTGIKRKEVAKIFDRFYSGPKGGIGLGLAFCARVINSFKGTIICRSEYGEYTEFVIRLPREEN
jgi:two-component system CAI-1 autoinducer sensor kinase/phosphatase CqsS